MHSLGGHRRRRRDAAGLALVLLLTGTSLAAAAPARTDDRVAGQVVVRFRTDATAAARKAARVRASTAVVRALRGSGLQLLSTAEPVNAAVARLRRDRAVRAASPNLVYRGAARLPNDPFFSQLWGLDNSG